MNDHGPVLRRKEVHLKERERGAAIRSDGLIAINDRDETSFRESSRLISGRSIANRGWRCNLIA